MGVQELWACSLLAIVGRVGLPRCRLVVKLVKVDSRLGRVFGYSSSTTI